MLTAKSHANELMVYDEFVYFLLACHACMSVNKCAYGLLKKRNMIIMRPFPVKSFNARFLIVPHHLRRFDLMNETAPPMHNFICVL